MCCRRGRNLRAQTRRFAFANSAKQTPILHEAQMTERDNFETLSQDLLPSHYQDMDAVFQAWALFETALTMWLLALMEIEDDIGRIIIDRLDTRAKLARIKEIYQHLGSEDNAKVASTVVNKLEQWIKIRNTLAHKPRQGINSAGTHLYFWTGKFLPGNREEMDLIGINVADLKKCAGFASRTAAQIMQQVPRSVT